MPDLEMTIETRLAEQLAICQDAGYRVRFAVTQEPDRSIVSAAVHELDGGEHVVTANVQGPDDTTTRGAALSKAVDAILANTGFGP